MSLYRHFDRRLQGGDADEEAGENNGWRRAPGSANLRFFVGREVAVAAGVIGRGLYIKGELHGEEDLIIEGTVEGTITMQKSLTIEAEGRIKADIETENITVRGEMVGDLTAREKITLHAGSKMVGDMRAPRIEIEDGAYYKGRIDMPSEG